METTTEKLLTRDDKPPGRCVQWQDWKWQLRNGISSLDQLEKLFFPADYQCRAFEKVNQKYPFAVTPYYLSLIDKGDPDDPIRKQCLPSAEELIANRTEDDPLGEEKDSVLPGLIHRYPDRVLVTLTDMCPVYCRHCTRKREWQDGKWVRKPAELEEIYGYIRSHPAVRDVIISGGDPLLLSTPKIETVLRRLRQIPHVEIIRIGTRCPVVLPQRIDNDLVAMLKKYRPLWMNTHFNHPNEITPESSLACDRLVCAGVPVNNQSVLLKGVNDDVNTMIRLCEKLLTIGVRPYYLFQCDPVSGTAHLRTSIEKGLEIIGGMRGRTSGLAIPTFVIDGLNGQGKIPLQPNYLVDSAKDHIVLRGRKGDLFKYYNPRNP